jgi:elongation factor G
MPNYTAADIRNLALVGHTGAGKTSLAEAVMHLTGVTGRLGSVADKTSHLDFMEEEKERGCSIDSALLHATSDGCHLNVVDTPGAPDFVGPAISALAGVESAVCVVSASAGIEVNTRRMMDKAAGHGLARAVVINKIDAENVELPKLLADVQEVFGQACKPINLPTGGGSAVINCLDAIPAGRGSPDFGDLAEARTAIIEAVAESDEALMEAYFDAGDLTPEQLSAALPKALAAGTLIPICFTNARGEVGVNEFLEVVRRAFPNPLVGKQRVLKTKDNQTPIAPDADGPLIGQVFKVTSDPKSNIKYSVIRIHSGQMRADANICVGDDRRGVRPGALHKLQGAEHPETDLGIAGDIIAVAKLDLHIGQVVHDGHHPGTIALPALPSPMFALAIEPKSRADADKVSGAVAKFHDEDPCFIADREASTGELVIRGVGDLHLRTVLSRMHRQFKLDVDTKPPKIPYRETISAKVTDVEYTHKKQTGGAGQYARVVINIEPMERGGGYEFVDKIFGGSIDQSYRPSVDKGVQAQMKEGVIAGYPVVDVRVLLVDGKTHPVDSKDIAFQIAGREAFKVAVSKAKPVLLEPIVNVEVTIPAANVGDVQGDLASRRGRPQGQDMLPGGMAVIKAQVPLAEVADYHSRLSSITGGQGSYSMELSHYEVVPAHVQQQIIDAAKKAKAEAQK